MQKRRDGSVLVLSKAVQILKACHELGRGLSLGEIARHVDLPRSTVQRIVQTLASESFLSTDGAAKSITLGPDLLAMGAMTSAGMVERAYPQLKRLAQRTGETVDLALLNRDHLIFISQVPGVHRLQAVSAVGDTFPLHCTANGKAALALLPDDRINMLLQNGLPAMTPNTLTSATDLKKEIERIRKSGLAYDREEHTLGISAIGMATQDKARQIYAVSIPVPSVRFSQGLAANEAALRETVLALTTP
ncbi:MAG: IclR family transcriptional regulator [Alphaproteobacteria bacterium]|nr:IclR family transcriptional regulator [Alphaproteobacteria bacterium]